MKRILVVFLLFWQIGVLYAQTTAIVNTGEIISSYIDFYSNIGFSKGDIIIYNGLLRLLDNSNSLHDMDLALLSKEKLRLLRNTIYAKHGLIFNSADLQRHFSQFDWYKPLFRNVDDKLSPMDEINLRAIQAYENMVPNYNVRVGDLTGLWLGSYPVAAGYLNSMTISEDGAIEIGYNEMSPKVALHSSGSCRIENGFLVIDITKQRVHFGEYFTDEWLSKPMAGDSKIATLTYNKPVRMVLPIGELEDTKIREYEVRGRIIGAYFMVVGK
ncbi:hypothetical protein AGMMS50268_39550 [Spirochaetia bacterium]|nr:hypothetical protein AGMMS50268_39550 [Spirochaetia bacterium]